MKGGKARTIEDLTRNYRKEWGIIVFGLSAGKAIEYGIERYIELDPFFAHIMVMVLISMVWSASDFFEVDVNEDARFWK